MVINPLDVFTVIIGAVGAITGVISLIWHIINTKPKIKLESVYFGKDVQESKVIITVKINLRNLSHSRPTTIEDIMVDIGQNILKPPFFQPFRCEASSSEDCTYLFTFTDKEFKELYENGKIKLGVYIVHTFGLIKKFKEVRFSTGHVTLR